MKRLLTDSLLGLLLAAVLTAGAYGKPLRVYILAGQSNMEGHARIKTFGFGDDPATASLIKKMRGADGNKLPRVDQ